VMRDAGCDNDVRDLNECLSRVCVFRAHASEQRMV